MHLTVDGIIYKRQTWGGVSRIFNEILPRMCDLDASLTVNLFTLQGTLLQQPPVHPQIRRRVIPRIERFLRPWRLWENKAPLARQWVQSLWTGAGKHGIWHSTYFTLPRKWKGKQVVTIYDMIYERFPELFRSEEDVQFRRQKRQCLLAADRVICISETTSRDVQQFYGIPSKAIRVVPLAHNTQFKPLSRPELSSYAAELKKPFLLYVGSRNSYKNFALLLKSFSDWASKRDIDLVVVDGKPWTTAEQDQIANLHVTTKVHLLPKVRDEELIKLYNQAVAFVYPSLYEGFGIPLLEAMACGCPVIASNIPSTTEVAGGCPIYFEPLEPDSLLVALNQTLVEGRKSSRCNEGLKIAGNYSWDGTARQTLAVYREL